MGEIDLYNLKPPPIELLWGFKSILKFLCSNCGEIESKWDIMHSFITYFISIKLQYSLCIKHTIVHQSSILRLQHQSQCILLSKWPVLHVPQTSSQPFWIVAPSPGKLNWEWWEEKTQHDKVSELAVQDLPTQWHKFQYLLFRIRCGSFKRILLCWPSSSTPWLTLHIFW